MSAAVLFLFSFYFGGSLFCGRTIIESANGIITPNSFVLTEIQVSFFFPCPAEIIPCRNERSEVYGDRLQCVGESLAVWIYGVCGSRSLVMLIYATNNKDTKNHMPQPELRITKPLKAAPGFK